MAIGIFWLFGAVMAFLAGTTLVWRGTTLDRVWTLNPRAYKELAPLGRLIGIPFVLLGVTLAVVGIGWFNRCVWAWRLAAAIIATQVLGNFVNIFFGRIVEGATGIAIASTLLFYLFRPKVRAVFGRGNASGVR